MKKKRISGLNTKDLGAVASDVVLPGILGGVVAGFLDKVPGFSSNTQYVNYGALAIGIILAATQKGAIASAGIGMAVVGGTKVANDLIDGQAPGANGLGLQPPGVPSYRIGEMPNSGGPGFAVKYA